MARNLTTSQVDRQNILNNENAVAEIQNQTGLQGIIFEGRLRFTKAMVASFFEVEVRTIERYVSENLEEISANGYEIIKGKRLKDFLNCVLNQDVPPGYWKSLSACSRISEYSSMVCIWKRWMVLLR